MTKNNIFKWIAAFLLLAFINIYVINKISQSEQEDAFVGIQFQEAFSVKMKNNHTFFHEESFPVNQSIFLIESSSRSALTLKELCAFESAALVHPNRSVYYLMTNISPQQNEPMNDIESSYTNAKIISIDLTYVFKGSPFEKLWLNNRLQKSMFYNAHLADILRFWFLYNYGGTYLDSDTITLKPLPEYINFAGVERMYPFLIENAILHFHQGHPILKSVIQDISLNYDGNNWSSNGPVALTKHVRAFCKADDLEGINKDSCPFHLMPPRSFFSIYYPSWKRFFDPNSKEYVKDRIKDSLGIHYWGKLSLKTNIQPGMPIYDIAMEKCPKVAKYFK